MWEHRLKQSPLSHLSMAAGYASLVAIILSLALTSCAAMTTCPASCQCSRSKLELLCQKVKMADVVGDFDPTLKHMFLDKVGGLETLMLSSLDPGLKANLLTLRITDSAIKEIPDGTFSQFGQLQRLDLSRNNLMNLGEGSLFGLKELTSLSLAGNRLMNLGKSLAPLASLESLHLSSNALQELPKDVFVNQTSLVRLYLNGNPLKSVNADSMIGLDKVQELHLRDCSLDTLTDDFFHVMPDLLDLDLGQNRLSSFLSPRAVSHMAKLRYLRFDNNEIQALSKLLFKDVRIQTLDLAYNRINSVDDFAFENSSVKSLDLSYNMILPLTRSFLRPMSEHVTNLNLAGNPLGELADKVFSDLKLLKSLNVSSCRLDALPSAAFEDLHGLEQLDVSHNNIHYVSQATVNFIDRLRTVNLHANAWVCDCHIKSLSKWLQKSSGAKTKMYCPTSHVGSGEEGDCTELRCAAPSQLEDTFLADLRFEDMTGCKGEHDSDGLPASTQGAIVASCMGFAVVLLIITICLWKRGKTRYGLKRVCVPSDAESSHVVDEDSKVPPLSNCDRASLNESDHSFVVRHYFDTLVTDPKLMSRTSDSEEPTSPKERDSLYSSQPSLYSNPNAPFGIESTV